MLLRSFRVVRQCLFTTLFALGFAAQAAHPIAVDDKALPSLAPVIKKASPAVVNIATESHVKLPQNPLLNDPFFRRYFRIPEQPRERKTQSLGSGVVIDATRGLVVTNNHVIANADQITVQLEDGRTFEAEVVGTDPETDVAVIRIPAEKLTAIPLADSDELQVGDFVVAIGNPFGLGHTVTSGIVSALGRSGLGIGGYEDYIQTDASINPGNSGGALVNLRGELIGINTAIFSQSGGNIGIGFAIPTNMAKQVTEQLAQHGEVKRGFLGAQMQNLDSTLAEAFGVARDSGAVIVDIQPGSPADKSGLRAGDIVTAVDGKPVSNAVEVRNRIGLLPVGTKLQIDILRNGKHKRVLTSVESQDDNQVASDLQNPRLGGAIFGDIDERSPAYGRIRGAAVLRVERGSNVWRSGLREGDIVTSVNRAPVTNFKEFLARVNQTQGPLLFRVQRGNAAAFMVLR